jgi:hypothetical protein
LKGKIMSGNPVFRGTRVPVHMLAELVPSRARYRPLALVTGASSGMCPRARARARGTGGEV